jgi:hypothetical protein
LFSDQFSRGVVFAALRPDRFYADLLAAGCHFFQDFAGLSGVQILCLLRIIRPRIAPCCAGFGLRALGYA